MTTIRRYLDLGVGFAGSMCTLTGITFIAGWEYALLTGGLALIGLALVMPTWD